MLQFLNMSLIHSVTTFGHKLGANVICKWYPDQSHARAFNLHKRIRAGRTYRRIHLEMIILKEKNKKEKLIRLFPIEMVKNNIARFIQKKSVVVCHGCLYKVKRDVTTQKEYQTMQGQKEIVTLCQDCEQDTF